MKSLGKITSLGLTGGLVAMISCGGPRDLVPIGQYSGVMHPYSVTITDFGLQRGAGTVQRRLRMTTPDSSQTFGQIEGTDYYGGSKFEEGQARYGQGGWLVQWQNDEVWGVHENGDELEAKVLLERAEKSFAPKPLLQTRN